LEDLRQIPHSALARLIANLTHELKTPLHSILAVASLLRSESDGDLADEQKRQVDMITRNAEALLEMIRGLLDFSSVDTGSRPVRISRFDIHSLCEEIVQSLVPVAQKASVAIESDIEKLEGSFFSDKSLVRQIVNNLLSNAVKFSPDGGKVLFFAERTKDGSVILEVADSGIGMPVEVQNSVFREFYQAEDGDTRRFGGVGLGLALVRTSLELLGGSIDVKSEKGKGSLFTVRIPDSQDRLPKRKILIVESDSNVQLTLTECFKAQGYESHVTADERDAKMYFADKRPDLVMLDLKGAEVESFSLLNEFRSSSWGAETPVIVMSALDGPRERSRSFELGASDFIVKPFDLVELLARVKSQFERE